MKHLNLILGFGLAISSLCVGMEIGKKTKPFSVVEVDRLEKYVYRGIPNEISVSVPGSKSVNVTGNGLEKLDDSGHYKFTPGGGTTAILRINAVMADGSKFRDSAVLRIGNIPARINYFSGETSNFSSIPKMNFDRLDQGKLTVRRDLRIEETYDIRSFTVKIPGKNPVIMNSDSLSPEIMRDVRKLKRGAQITMYDIKGRSSLFSGMLCDRNGPIVIEIL